MANIVQIRFSSKRQQESFRQQSSNKLVSSQIRFPQNQKNPLEKSIHIKNSALHQYFPQLNSTKSSESIQGQFSSQQYLRQLKSEKLIEIHPKSKSSILVVKEEEEVQENMNKYIQQNVFHNCKDISQREIVLQQNIEKLNLPELQVSNSSLNSSGAINSIQKSKVHSFAGNSNQGLIRDYNEDRNIHIQQQYSDIQFYGIYDGHGGMGCVEQLKDNLHKYIFQQLIQTPKNIKEAIRKGFHEMECKLCSQKSIEKSGACALVVIIIDSMCYVANVGDCRAIISAEQGKKVYQITQDHKPEEETERIQNAGGQIYQSKYYRNGTQDNIVLGPHRILPGKLSVSRAFGDLYAKLINPYVLIAEPDIIEFNIKDEYDFIFMGCDGIYDKNTNENIVQIIWTTAKSYLSTQTSGNIHIFSQLCVDNAIKESMAKSSYDNLSAIFINLSDLIKFKQNYNLDISNKFKIQYYHLLKNQKEKNGFETPQKKQKNTLFVY